LQHKKSEARDIQSRGGQGALAARYGRAPAETSPRTRFDRGAVLSAHPQLAALAVVLTYFIFPSFAISVKSKEKPT